MGQGGCISHYSSCHGIPGLSLNTTVPAPLSPERAGGGPWKLILNQALGNSLLSPAMPYRRACQRIHTLHGGEDAKIHPIFSSW